MAIIVGIILVIGMLQSFATGNTEMGVFLLVLLGVNVVANVIYQAIATKRNASSNPPIGPQIAGVPPTEPLHDVPAPTGLHAAVLRGDTETVRSALVKSANVNAKSEEGWPPLRYAVYSGDLDMVSLLVAHGADVNARNDDGSTPLLQAAHGGDKTIAELLLANGADVNAADRENGWTPLHIAASNGHAEVVGLLLENSADVSVLDSEGNTALDLADDQETRNLVEAHTTKESLLFVLAAKLCAFAIGDEKEDAEYVRNRLDKRINPEAMARELFCLRYFAVDYEVTQALGYTELRGQLLDAFQVHIALAGGTEDLGLGVQRAEAYEPAVNTTHKLGPFYFVGKTFCLLCEPEHLHVPQLIAISIDFFHQLIFVKGLVDSAKLSAP
ncbi:MAG: ankyrin repeat domain-containing protein [Planctomycetota bacterium]